MIPFLLLAAVVAGLPQEAKEPRGMAYFLERVHDLDRLPVLEEGVASDQASSYDRSSRYDAAAEKYVAWDANKDYGHYIRIIEETGEAVMADLTGPGCINRIWSANPQGLIRFYIDGAETPYEFEFEDLCTGKVHPFLFPMVWKRSEMLGTDNPASCSYLPIPYAKSCVVTADTPNNQYYQIGYTTFPAGTLVKSFFLPLMESETAALTEACARLANLGLNPQPAELTRLGGDLEAAPGQEAVFAEIDGPATVCELRLALESDERFAWRRVLLKVVFDDAKQPSVLAPLGDFFGQSFGDDPYHSLPMGFENGVGYCYFRMPFNLSARFTVKNLGRKPVALRYTVGYRSAPPPEGFAYFHAGWRREKYCSTFDYPVLDCRGRGKFVGMALFVDNVHGGWWGEGDEKIHVDGEKFPSYFGTGSEDYFGDAWGIRDFANAFHGCPLTVDDKQSCYRWHIPDPVPFNSTFRFTMENYSARDNAKNDYASMAYFYKLPAGCGFFKEPDLLDVLPRVPSRVKGALEAESLYSRSKLPKGARIVLDEDFPFELSGGSGLELPGKPGSMFYLPLQVPRRDFYKIGVTAAAHDGAAKYAVTVNNKPVGDSILLEKGKVLVCITLHGSNGKGKGASVIVDYLELTAQKRFIKKWIVVGPFDNPDNTGLSFAYPPELEKVVDYNKAYDGKDGQPIGWQVAEAGEDGVVDLLKYMESSTWTVAYAYVDVNSASAMETDLYLGSDDGVKVWINGEVVHDHRVDRGLTVDEDHVSVKLVAGVNRVLVKVDQGIGGWNFCLRFRDADGLLSADINSVQGIEEK